MSRQISVKPYRRRFRRPLRTARGEWALREGFVLRVEEVGKIGYGEVAPLPEFGAETVAEAAAFLEELVLRPELEVPVNLPSCRFGLSVAASESASLSKDYFVAALLPAGEAGLNAAAQKIEDGYKCLKWKIGVEPTSSEISYAVRLLQSLPEGVSLRLDANASLSLEQLDTWLGALADYRAKVDYLEQPLAVSKEDAMAVRMAESGIPIALDESLNGAAAAQWLEAGAWKGPLVIKAPLMGEVDVLVEKLQPFAEQVVLSSVFETGIGLENCLRLADALPAISRPIGYDTVDAFEDGLTPLESSPCIRAADRNRYTAQQIWDLL